MSALYRRQLRVVYPVKPVKTGRIVLRTERDWERDVEPDAISDDGSSFTFTVESEKPFLYFKPCLRAGNEFYWDPGANKLLLMTEPDTSAVYPYFTSSTSGAFAPVVELDSTHLGRRHRLCVYLPPGYAENTLKRYPVLYMQDGQNLFFPEEAFMGREWSVDETLHQLDSMSAIDNLIVVGIYSQDRMAEYTQPGYQSYGLSLVNEVKPAIDARFRTEREHTSVLGSSLGGVVSFFLAWEWPNVFRGAGCMSSTFTYHDDLLERVLSEPKRESKFYLDSGWPGDNYEVTLAMAMALIQCGYVYGRDMLHFVFPLAPHDENAWGFRFHLPLQLLSGVVRRTSLASER